MQMQFSNKWYDRLKFVALIVLPATAALYLGLGQIWGLPETEKVVTSIALLATFLGTLLQISNSKYKDEETAGYLDANGYDPDTGLANLQMFVRKHPDEILEGDKAVFKIGPPPPLPTKPADSELGEVD